MRQVSVCVCVATFVAGSLVMFFGEVVAQEMEEVELPEIVVTATRYWEQERNVPYNLSVITEEEIERSNAQNVADLFRTVPGVVVSDLTANRKSIQVDIRGFGETGPLNTLVLVDGRRVNEIDLSGTEWTQIPLDQIEHIEVLRGGGSVLYGNNAVGGVINIVTKLGEGKPWVEGEFTLGSYELDIEQASSGGELGGFRYTAHARHEDTDGFRDNGDYEARDFGGSFGYDIGNFIKLDFSANYHDDKFGLPGPLTEEDIRTGHRNDTTRPDDRGETEDYYLRFKEETDFKSSGTLILDLSYRKRRSKSHFPSYGDYTATSDIPTVGFTPRWKWERGFGRFQNKLIAGFDFYHSEARLKSLSPFFTSTLDMDRDTWGVYVYDEFAPLENLIVSLGGRYEKFEDHYDLTSTFVTSRDENSEELDAWEVGVTYLVRENSKVFGRISKSYRYPMIDELFSFLTGTVDRTLDSQNGITYEAGLDHAFGSYGRGGFSVFYMEIDDEIFFNPLTFTNENYDRTKRRGVEAFGEVTPCRWGRLWATYTYTRATFGSGEFSGNDVPMVPRDKASGGIELTPLEGLSINVWANYVDQRYLVSDQANEAEKLDDYATVNANASYTWKVFTLFFAVNNIFDEEYAEYGVLSTAGVPNVYPSPGINMLGGVRLRL